MFIRKAATVVAGAAVALVLAAAPAAAAAPVAQPAATPGVTIQQAPAGLTAPTALHPSFQFASEQECNRHRFEVARYTHTTNCVFRSYAFRPGGYWQFRMWR